jgi:arylsulfatase A-like enzyme
MNVIILMSDSLRKDHVGYYGNDWIKTPNMDRFASDSIVFENAYPEGLPTMPVRASIFTGNYTLTNRFWKQLLPEDVTMAEILDEYGYTSAIITDNYHFFKPNMNYHRGFHEFVWIRGQEADAFKARPHTKDIRKYMKDAMKDDWALRELDQYFRNVEGREKEQDYFPAKVMKESVRWLEETAGVRQPFFLYIDCFDPHEPWDPPPSYASMYTDPDYEGPWLISPKGGPVDWMSDQELRHTRGLYAGEVSLVDTWIGYLYDNLEKLGLLDNTVIFFLADHGHPLGEHGKILKLVDLLYNELLRIPLMVRLPGRRHAGKRVTGLVQTVDIFPTVLDLLGFNHETEFLQGKSFVPLLESETDKIREYATMGFFSAEHRCIRDERWSYIRRPEGEEPELYDLVEDWEERRNLVGDFPDIARKLDDSIAKVFNCRLQKEHWSQVRYDIPGLCERRFPPLRYWKK